MPLPVNSATYAFPVAIEPADIDFMGHVNNAIYLEWVQEAVVRHWRHFASAEDVLRHLWVATKHEITYCKPAFLDDEIVATVELKEVRGPRAFYETIVRRGAEILAEVRSSWCCVDAETHRPVRIGKSIIERFV